MRTKLQMAADRAALVRRRSIGVDLLRLREDAGLSKVSVALAAGIDASHLGRIEAGDREASLAVLYRVAAALGADVGLRIFPNSGPAIRDRIQAPMIEALLGLASPAWDRHVEVPVQRPVRGIIDLVLAHRPTRRIVSVEAHSELRRVEQQIRWATEKSDALPSAVLWPAIAPADGAARTSRVLLLRSTSATRGLVRMFASTMSAAYPADPTDVFDAVVDPTRPWPGNGIVWVRVDGRGAEVLRRAPRGVSAFRSA